MIDSGPGVQHWITFSDEEPRRVRHRRWWFWFALAVGIGDLIFGVTALALHLL